MWCSEIERVIEMTKVKIEGTVEEETKEKVKKEAEKEKRSISSVVRQSIHEYLERKKDN